MQESSGLCLADYDVLVPLSEAREGRLRVFEIACDLGWEQSRLSHHLTRMQRRGLITREECSADGRGAFVVSTTALNGQDDGQAVITVTTLEWAGMGWRTTGDALLALPAAGTLDAQAQAELAWVVLFSAVCVRARACSGRYSKR